MPEEGTMKKVTKVQKLGAVLGAGLLMAAVSGSAFAMHATQERETRRIEVRQEDKSATPASASQMEFTGTVEVMASDMWVVGGRTIRVTAATEIKAGLQIGAQAKVHVAQQADGSLWAREIEAARTDDQSGNVNSNDDNGNDDDGGNVNSNDDNGNDDSGGNVNSNDDNGNDDHGGVNSNDDNGNDDHGSSGNSNDDNGNDDDGGNGNDDHGGNVNSNDDNGNDDHGGGNSNDDNGNDDHGGSGNSNDDNGNDDHGGKGHG
jgi:hypothetical protein